MNSWVYILKKNQSYFGNKNSCSLWDYSPIISTKCYLERQQALYHPSFPMGISPTARYWLHFCSNLFIILVKPLPMVECLINISGNNHWDKVDVLYMLQIKKKKFLDIATINNTCVASLFKSIPTVLVLKTDVYNSWDSHFNLLIKNGNSY